MKHKEYIFRFLRQARIRLSLAIFVDVMIIVLAAGFGVGTVINTAALLFPIYGAFRVSWIALGIVAVAGMIYAIVHFPNQKKTALEIDKKGLKERLTTFLELEKQGSDWADLQAEDTYRAVTDYNLKENTQIRIKKKPVYFLAGMIALFVVAAVLPSPNKELAIVQHEQKEKAKAEIEKLEEAREELEELAKMEQLTEADLAEIEKMQDILEKAREELEEAKTQEELEKALERLETKTLQNLSENKQTASQNKASDLKKKLEEFLKKTENQSKETFTSEELADILNAQNLEALEQLLGELSEEELAELLEELEASLAEGSLSKEQLEQLAKAMENLSPSNGASNQLAQIMEGTLGISSSSNQSASSQNGQYGNGNGSGNNGGNGSGNSGGSGTGTGSGYGQGGSGIGGGQNHGSKNGIEKENNRVSSEEQVTIPGREVGGDESLTGQPTEGESYQSHGGPGLTWAGERVNYEQVVGEYTQEAYSKIENNEVPKGMEDVVKSYFEGINQ